MTAAIAVLVLKAVEFLNVIGFKMVSSLAIQQSTVEMLTAGFYMKAQINQIIFGKQLKVIQWTDRF